MSWQACTAAGPLIKSLTSPTAKFILLTLANYADQKGVCWPSQCLLAEDTGFGERTVRRTLAELEERGIISREDQRRKDGSRTSDKITLLFVGKTPREEPEQAARESGSQPATVAATNRPEEPVLPATVAGLTTFEPVKETKNPVGLASAEAETGESLEGSARGWLNDSEFQQAWGLCTDRMRGRSISRAKTQPIWRRESRKAGGSVVLLGCLVRYLAEDADVGRTGGPGFHRWLSCGTWEHWLGEPDQGVKATELPAPIDWSRRGREWRLNRFWHDDWGPKPGRAGCLAPPEILSEAA